MYANNKDYEVHEVEGTECNKRGQRALESKGFSGGRVLLPTVGCGRTREWLTKRQKERTGWGHADTQEKDFPRREVGKKASTTRGEGE